MCCKGNGGVCWEINPSCQAKKLSQAEIKRNPCMAYEQRTECWKIDWAAQLKDKPQAEKGFWQGFYNTGCPNCPVGRSQREQVREMIENINVV